MIRSKLVELTIGNWKFANVIRFQKNFMNGAFIICSGLGAHVESAARDGDEFDHFLYFAGGTPAALIADGTSAVLITRFSLTLRRCFWSRMRCNYTARCSHFYGAIDWAHNPNRRQGPDCPD